MVILSFTRKQKQHGCRNRFASRNEQRQRERLAERLGKKITSLIASLDVLLVGEVKSNAAESCPVRIAIAAGRAVISQIRTQKSWFLKGNTIFRRRQTSRETKPEAEVARYFRDLQNHVRSGLSGRFRGASDPGELHGSDHPTNTCNGNASLSEPAGYETGASPEETDSMLSIWTSP